MNYNIIPPLRNDIHLTLKNIDGQNYIIMTDKNDYAREDIAITYEFYDLIISIGGKINYSELSNYLQIDNELIATQLVQNIRNLDDLGYLASDKFRAKRDEMNREYLNLDTRPYICAGSSYPEDKSELEAFLDNLFASADYEKYRSSCSALITPHIDLRLIDDCHEIYASAYHSAADHEFDLIIILGTAHYESSNIFMLSEKNYSTPLGVLETDREFIDLWKSKAGELLEVNEYAHRPEHSIEYPVLLSQYYFKNRKFKILPILVSSFSDFINDGKIPESSEKFNILINTLRESIEESGRNILIIASVDFAHIGRKFGDDYDAAPALDKLKTEDKKLIDSICNLDKFSFIEKISSDCDKYKICGTSPIYCLLSLDNYNRVDFLKYGQWNEVETKSAVSFASLAFYK